MKDNGNMFLEAALSYIKRGLFVFPIKPREKVPLTMHGFKDSSNDPEVIQSWWKRWPSANIGLACGKSEIVVIDLDKDRNGLSSWEALCEENDINYHTLTSCTGGGGKHILYLALKNIVIGNSTNLKKLGIDVRGDGGYIVLPPSVHPNGRIYQWEDENWSDIPIIPLPEILIDLLTENPSMKSSSCLESKISKGERNSTLTSLAGSMRYRGMSVESIESALLKENEAQCDPPLAVNEVINIVKSISRYPAGGSTGEFEELDFHFTDQGNAQRLVARHGQDLRYCHPWRKWLVWDGKRWRRDATAEIERRAKETVKHMYKEAADGQDSEIRKKFAKYAITSESERKLKAMIALASSEAVIPILPDELDTNIMLLNCQNGTIDLRTGEISEHKREDMLTKIIPAEYIPDAECPMWDDFLYRIMDGDKVLIRFLQSAIGYSLTGDTSEQCFFVLYGSGANGKTTFLETIVTMLAEYAVKTPTETLMMRRGDSIPNDLARLAGARLVASSEAESGRRLAEAMLKQMTGGDTLIARFLHQEWFEFTPKFKLWIATNHKPVIKGTDDAIWRRIRLIPFNVKIPEPDQDKKLLNKLRSELTGILRWAVDGCLTWQISGLGQPDEIRKATTNYRDEMDTLGAFLEECCVHLPGAKVRASTLYKSYCDWCDKSGEKAVTANSFGRALAERGYHREKETTGRRLVYYYGLGLTNDED